MDHTHSPPSRQPTKHKNPVSFPVDDGPPHATETDQRWPIFEATYGIGHQSRICENAGGLPGEGTEMDRTHSPPSRQADVRTPKSVSLQPGERTIGTCHKHPAVLLWATFTVLIMLDVAGWLSNYVPAGGLSSHVATGGLYKYVPKHVNNGDVILAIWVVWAVFFLYLVGKINTWATSYLVITNKRIILTTGQELHPSTSIDISKVTSWSLRNSSASRFHGDRYNSLIRYYSLVVQLGGDDKMVRTIARIPGTIVKCIEEVLPSAARIEDDEEVFKEWAPSGLRHRLRLIASVLLFCLLAALAVAAAKYPRIRTELHDQADIIALLSVVLVLVTPKS